MLLDGRKLVQQCFSARSRVETRTRHVLRRFRLASPRRSAA